MSRWLFLLCLLGGASAQAVGYYLAGNPIGALALLAFALMWGLADWRQWTWFASLYLGMMLLAAVVGILVWEIPFVWNFASLLAALLLWDLQAFSRRLALAAPEDDRVGLQRRHELRLLQFSSLAIILAAAARSISLELSFGWSFWLVVLLAVALTRTVLWLRRQAATS